MAWSACAFSRMSDNECGSFLYKYMWNIPKDNNSINAYKDVLKFIIGGIMVQTQFRLIFKQAQSIITELGLKNLSPTKNYNKKYGLRLEHTIPISFITDYLLSLPKAEISEDSLLQIIKAVRGISLISIQEDNLLKKKGLQSKLPDGCTIDMLLGDSPKIPYSIRYDKIGIQF